jgi:hypothetical protein
MNYNEPLQHLGYIASRVSNLIYLKSTVNILAKENTTFSRIKVINNVVNNPLPEASKPGTPPVPDYIIEYNLVTDRSRNSDSTFTDIVPITLMDKVSLPVTNAKDAAKDKLESFFTKYNRQELRVMIKVYSQSPTGVVTTTISDHADIEIV